MRKLIRLPDGTRMYIQVDHPREILERHGLSEFGHVQEFHTQNVLNHMVKYMPYKTGQLTKLTRMQTNIRVPEIVTNAPQARYLYHGKVMVNSKTGKGPGYIPGVGLRYHKGTTLKATERPLTYNTTKNPLAGPYWDRRMVVAEGRQMAQELQDYINKQRKLK